MKKLFSSLLFATITTQALAQNPQCPTRPFGDNTNACASTAFVQSGLALLISPATIRSLTASPTILNFQDSTSTNRLIVSVTSSGVTSFDTSSYAFKNNGTTHLEMASDGGVTFVSDGYFAAGFPIRSGGPYLNFEETGMNPFLTGTSTGAGASTITLAVGSSSVNDAYAGAVVTITSGPGVGEKKVIASYVGATRVATITGTWTVNPTASGYAIGNCSLGQFRTIVDQGSWFFEQWQPADPTNCGTPFDQQDEYLSLHPGIAGPGINPSLGLPLERLIQWQYPFRGSGARNLNISANWVNAVVAQTPRTLAFDALNAATNTLVNALLLTPNNATPYWYTPSGVWFGFGTGATPLAVVDVKGNAGNPQLALQQQNNTDRWVAYADFADGGLKWSRLGSGAITNALVSSATTGNLSFAGTQFIFQNGGFTGTLAWTPATSNKTITLPNGTTDFTATGGTSQVVKQTSAGGAFTVARLACADLSDASTGCSAAAGITALTGDVTATGPGSVAATLATVNSNVGTFGSATQSVQFTVNGKGLITAAADVTVTPAVGSITGLGTGVATFLATPSSANLASAVTNETGSGALVFGTLPSLVGATFTAPAVLSSTGSGTAGQYWFGQGTAVGTSMEWNVPSSHGYAFNVNNTSKVWIDSFGSLGVGRSPTFVFDVVGDINTTTLFRVAGTAGMSATLTVRDSAGIADCDIVVAGGIITSSTC